VSRSTPARDRIVFHRHLFRDRFECLLTKQQGYLLLEKMDCLRRRCRRHDRPGLPGAAGLDDPVYHKRPELVDPVNRLEEAITTRGSPRVSRLPGHTPTTVLRPGRHARSCVPTKFRPGYALAQVE